MESPKQFDVERAIIGWRIELSGPGSLTQQDIDELENHLRESMDDLAGQKLTAEEAFAVARQRLGNPVSLRDEYQKTNPSRLWSIRVCWMLAGYLSFTLIGTAATLVSKLAVFASFASGLRPGLANLSGILTLVGVWALFCDFLRNRCQSHQKPLSIPGTDLLNRRPITSALSIASIYLVMYILGQAVNTYLVRNLGPSHELMTHTYLTQALSNLALTCLVLLGATLAIQRLRREA